MKAKLPATGLLFLGLIVALGTLGLVYGLWSQVLTVQGEVNLGTVDAVFSQAFTDDDDVVDDVNKDPGATGDCPDLGGVDVDGDGLTSCDPSSPGPAATRYDKDVARCDATLNESDPRLLTVTVDNAYPSYWCTVWAHVLNNGSIPVKIQKLIPVSGNFTPGVELDLVGVEGACGTQIDPGDDVQLGAALHVLQAAPQGDTLSGEFQIQLVQWNEFDPAQCNF